MQNGVQVYRWLSPLGDAWFNGTTYADLLSGQAMRKFLDDAYESYYERFSEDYGSLIVAQFTDEPCSSYRSRLPKGALPYSDELPARFEEMHGYDPSPQFSLLFGPGQGAERFRLHYFQTVAALFEINFSKQLGDWCEAHGIALTGHYILEGTLFHQKLWGTQIMPHYRHQGIPGIDHLGRQIEERITGKQCQSVANQYGKKRILSELYGVAGGGLTFEDRWWIATQQITLGVNLLNPHLSLYTMAGCRKRDYPQNLFYQQPWWPLNKAVDEPLSRLCVALAQGKYNAEMLVIHPQQSTFVLWEAIPGDGVEAVGSDWKPVTAEAQSAVENLDAEFQALTNALLGAQRTFDYGDETILRDAGRVEMATTGARLVIGEMSYPLVVLPSLETIAASTFALLREFQNAGGPILRCGRAPRFLDGQASADLERWLDTLPSVEIGELAKAVAQFQAPLVEAENLATDDARLLWTHLRDLEGGERLVWLVNLNRNRDFAVNVTLGGAWKSASLLDTRSGASIPLSGYASPEGFEVRLPFSRTQGHLIHLFPASEAPSPAKEFKSDGDGLNSQLAQLESASKRVVANFAASGEPLRSLQTLDFEILVNGSNGNGKIGKNGGHAHDYASVKRSLELEIPAALWSVERLDDNALTLDNAAWKARDDWSPRAMPVIAIQEMLNRTHYKGPLDLRYSVEVGEFDSSRKVHLVLERPEHYRVSVNGTPVQASGLPVWRDIRWIPLDITGLLRAGTNEILLECANFQFGDLGEIHDQPARYGTEIESVYLVGDFGVEAQITGEEPRPGHWNRFDLPEDVAVRCIDEKSVRLVNPMPLQAGDVTGQGLPFYPGRLKFTASLPRTQGANKVRLHLGHLDGAVAEVAVDGAVVGTIWSHPLEIELPAAALQGGEISLTLYGTLRNLLGPHHHSAGELVQVGPDSFQPHPLPGEEAQGAHYATWLQRWMHGETHPVDWASHYCLLTFGEIGSAALRYE